MDSPAVTALGEVGMDCSEGATRKPFDMQKSTLRWVLVLARPYMPLVLHVRASGEGPQATDILYREVLGVMQEKVPNTLQSIHLHCFNGDPVTVKLWSDSYPGNLLWVLRYGEEVWGPAEAGAQSRSRKQAPLGV